MPKLRKEMSNSLVLALNAIDRCRELLINADADADDLAEYDAARNGLYLTLHDYVGEAFLKDFRAPAFMDPKP